MKDYKKILEGLVNIINNTEKSDIGFANICTFIGENCPELKESEDERIRGSIIDHLKDSNLTEWAAWLEKQGKKELENYDEAEKEKADFVGDGFIECHADFLDFKEGETYWLEYIGDDKYNVRSDNILGKTYHITPCQLYTVFKKLTWLKSLEERVLPRQKQEWSEDDSARLQRVINFLIRNRKGDTDTIYQQEQDIDWLKSFEERVIPKQKQEWSEDDER